MARLGEVEPIAGLSVVVPNWNGEELLVDCLGPLPEGGYEVIVVDNASEDGSLRLLRERFPWVRVIENRENRGFSVACNQGIDAASSEHVLLLNNDTVPDPAALDALVVFLEARPRVAVVGPTLLRPDGSRQRSCGPGPNLRTELAGRFLLHRAVPGLRARAPEVACRVDWVTGAALAIRRDVAVALGGFDEGMFMFYEDLDLCARARAAGYEVWFVPTEPIVHLWGASRRKVEARALVDSFRSTDRYFARHGPAGRRRLLRWLTVPEMAVRSALWTVMAALPGRRAQARERLRAYRRILAEVAGRRGALGP